MTVDEIIRWHSGDGTTSVGWHSDLEKIDMLVKEVLRLRGKN